MLINTHMMIASDILNKANGKKVYLINRKRFIWGNIKPDCVSKYKFRKHYYDESIDMILKKIKFLSSMSISDLYYDYGKAKFSEELGVICHFLCDFFCVPHNKRWEFKKAIKKHVLYEKGLAKEAKSFITKVHIDSNLSVINIKEFIEKHQKEYEKKTSFKNDLEYSCFICNSVINAILNQVALNEYLSENKAS